MGTDIHLVIDQRDTDGKWHTIWHTYLPYSDWFKTRFLDPIGKDLHDDPYKIYNIDFRGYGYFSVLSGARRQNLFAQYGIGDKDTGLVQPGFPKDATHATQDLQDDDAYHSKGWITLTDLLQVQKKINQLSLPRETEKSERDSLNFWISILQEGLANLTGPNAFLKQIIGRTPHEHEMGDPDYPHP